MLFRSIFFKLDENEKILEASKAFLDTLGYKKEEIEERNIGEFCSLGEIAFGRFKKDEEHKNISSIITFRRKDGNQIWLDCTATQENNALQNDGVQIIFAQDVSNEVRIKELSNIDDLTQIYNRKKLNETLELTIEHLKTNKEKSASFILFDIDDFKRVNDVYGHLVGDFILKEISQLAKSKLNSRDTIARWGGEEFAIILQDASMQDALKNAQNIRNAIANHNFEHVEQITCSFGLTEIGRAHV